MLADFPPSSSVRRLRLPIAACWTLRPTSVDPVNETLSTSSCEASAAPASASPVTTFQTPAGNPGLEAELGEPQRGERRLLRRLVDDAVAARECRCELPRRDQEREVPRRDRADDAEWLPQRCTRRRPGRRDWSSRSASSASPRSRSTCARPGTRRAAPREAVCRHRAPPCGRARRRASRSALRDAAGSCRARRDRIPPRPAARSGRHAPPAQRPRCPRARLARRGGPSPDLCHRAPRRTPRAPPPRRSGAPGLSSAALTVPG